MFDENTFFVYQSQFQIKAYSTPKQILPQVMHALFLWQIHSLSPSHSLPVYTNYNLQTPVRQAPLCYDLVQGIITDLNLKRDTKVSCFHWVEKAWEIGPGTEIP